MSKLLEKLNNLELIHNQNNLLNEKINKLKLEKTYPDDKKREILQQRKYKIQEDLKQYSVNSNIINTTKNEEKILGLIPNLLVKDNLECIDLLDIEENNNIELISSILNDNNNILSNISNNTNFVNFSSDNTSSDNTSFDNTISDNIEINDRVILQLFESNSFQDLNNNLKKINELVFRNKIN